MVHEITGRPRPRCYHVGMDIGGWFYEVGGERRGPLSLEQLRGLVHTRVVGRATKVWAEGMAEAVPAGDLAVLFPPQPETWMKWLLPVGRSGLAIATGYLGLFSLIPFVGYLTILIAILAILDLRQHREKSGWGRVIFGLLIAVPMSVLYSWMLFFPHR
jgi:hypothetical protein